MSISAQSKDYSGTVIVVNKQADSISFIDLASRSLVASRQTGKGPHELAVTQDGKWAVTTDYVGGNSLTVFDVQQAKAVRRIDLSHYPRPHGIGFMPDQQRVMVSSEGSDSVVIADIHQGKVTQVLPTSQQGSHMVAFPEHAQQVYTTNMRSDSVSEIDVASGKLLRTLAMPKTPEAVTINSTGTQLWVGSNQDGWVSVFDLASETLVKRWQDYSFPYRILLTRDQTMAVIPDFRLDTLDILNVKDFSRFKRLQFDKGTVPNGVFFHPDDRTLFMSAFGKDKVLVIDVPSGEILFELPTGKGPDGIGYSPLSVTQH